MLFAVLMVVGVLALVRWVDRQALSNAMEEAKRDPLGYLGEDREVRWICAWNRDPVGLQIWNVGECTAVDVKVRVAIDGHVQMVSVAQVRAGESATFQIDYLDEWIYSHSEMVRFGENRYTVRGRTFLPIEGHNLNASIVCSTEAGTKKVQRIIVADGTLQVGSW